MNHEREEPEDGTDAILGGQMDSARVNLKHLLEQEPTPRILDAIEGETGRYVSAGRESLDVGEYERKRELIKLNMADTKTRFYYLLLESHDSGQHREEMGELFKKYLSLSDALYELGLEWGIQI
jgi:hypothetical protein